MNKESLASLITRIHFCNNTKLESIEEFKLMKQYLLDLSDNKFEDKLKEYGLYDREAS